MKRAALAALLLAACAPEAPDTAAVDTREPIAVEYVRAPELEIHTRASDSSPIVTKYKNGESVSVLAKRDGWAEIRMPDRSGWVHNADLADAAQAKEAEAGSSAVRFKVPAEPVTEPNAHGEMTLEADVNGDGEVVAVRVIRNTTGSRSLEMKNIASLQRARFYPVVRHGRRTPFTYEQRVHY
jgi:uncharacterized protein YgiM (DUF1202 family)